MFVLNLQSLYEKKWSSGTTRFAVLEELVSKGEASVKNRLFTWAAANCTVSTRRKVAQKTFQSFADANA